MTCLNQLILSLHTVSSRAVPLWWSHSCNTQLSYIITTATSYSPAFKSMLQNKQIRYQWKDSLWLSIPGYLFRRSLTYFCPKYTKPVTVEMSISSKAFLINDLTLPDSVSHLCVWLDDKDNIQLYLLPASWDIIWVTVNVLWILI